MQSTSIIRRWIRGSLLITVLVLVLAEGLFLYYSYNDLYGGVERAVENRFSTVVGRLQATGTAGDTATTAESRANVLRRVVEQFDEKDKFEFMLLDARDRLGYLHDTPGREGHGRYDACALRGGQHRRIADGHKPVSH